MCWVALDRGIRLAHKRSFPAPLERWYKVRDEICHDIFTNFWNDKHQAFVQYKGAEVLDAATLLMPLVRFISPIDPRWLSTLRAIEETLVDDSLVVTVHVLVQIMLRQTVVYELRGAEGAMMAQARPYKLPDTRRPYMRGHCGAAA